MKYFSYPSFRVQKRDDYSGSTCTVHAQFQLARKALAKTLLLQEIAKISRFTVCLTRSMKHYGMAGPINNSFHWSHSGLWMFIIIAGTIKYSSVYVTAFSPVCPQIHWNAYLHMLSGGCPC